MTQRILYPLIALMILVPATGLPQEVGGPAGQPGTILNTLDARFEAFLAYQHLTGLDMAETYGNVPLFGAGVSFLIAPQLRTFFTVGYGKKSGDPFHDLPGFDTGQEITVKTLPFCAGLRLNIARSSRLKAHLGLALELAQTWEDIPYQLDDSGNLSTGSSSALLSGYRLSFAPEWILGQGKQGVGLELGYGGTKGTLHGENRSHTIDLTGFSGRAYFVFGL